MSVSLIDRMVMLEPATPVLEEQALTLRCAVWGGAKVEQAVFYKDNKEFLTAENGIYIIPSASKSHAGLYKCNATYKYSHISPGAASKTDQSDPQQIKVIGEHSNQNLLTSAETK